MPPAPGRERPADLWLCGHHYRSSRAALAATSAAVYDLTVPGAAAGHDRLAAMNPEETAIH
jgi:hypothetical protein